MRLVDADKIEYYPVNRDGKYIGEMVWKPHVDGIETFDLESHDKEIVAKFAEWLCDKYDIVEPEEDEDVLCGYMKYHSKEELLDEYFLHTTNTTK